MTNGRIKDHTTANATATTKKYSHAVQAIARRHRDQKSGTTHTFVLSVLFKRHRDERERHVGRTKSISTVQFWFTLNTYTSACCLSKISLTKRDIEVRLPYFDWNKSTASSNNCSAPGTAVSSIIFARLSMPNSLCDMETKIFLHSSQLSEMFWECFKHH